MNRSRLTSRIAIGAAIQIGVVAGPALGVTLRLAAESGVGGGATFFEARVQEWSARTGHRVESIQMPNSSSERLALYQQYWASGSADIDLYLIDVIWPGAASPHLLDLEAHLSAEEQAAYVPRLLDANRVAGRLVALPLWTDVGLLYARQDLLEKYGYTRAPETWQELTTWAAAIQAGERASDAAFHGFVWQGARYEGLTCNALEWLVSFGAGRLVGADGGVELDIERATSALEMARGWVGTISPRGVTTYMEEEARQVWQGGHAAFLRSWPYVHALSQASESRVRDRFLVAPLPRGPSGPPASTLGGALLAVSRHTRHPEAAVELLKFLAGPQVARARALELGQPPAFRALYDDPAVRETNPHFEAVAQAVQSVVIRPAVEAGARYNQVSNVVYTATHDILTGATKADVALRRMSDRLRRVLERR
jgi:trehalose/maltose transport system substrate-binding protein